MDSITRMDAGSLSTSSERCTVNGDGWSWVAPFLISRFPESSSTLQTQLGTWRIWREFLSSHKCATPKDVTRDIAERFLMYRLLSVKRVTAVSQIQVFHAILEEAVLRGLCSNNPLRKLKIARGPTPEKPEVTPALESEIRAAIAKEGSKYKEFLRVSMEIGLYQGRRIAETRFPISNVDFDRNTLRTWVKGGRWHVAPMHPRVRAVLWELKERGQHWTFDKPSDPSRFSFIWFRFFERHGFIERFPRLCFHSFRISCVSRLARAGVTESKAMKYVSHSSLLVHRHYQRIHVEDLDCCVNAL